MPNRPLRRGGRGGLEPGVWGSVPNKPDTIPELKALRDAGYISSNFPGIFLELSSRTPAQTPETAHSLLEFSENVALNRDWCDYSCETQAYSAMPF